MLSLAIVILNLITIIVFIKNRNLHKRGTYLMINLAVIDMLAGVAATESFANVVGVYSCNLWKDFLPDKLHVYVRILHILFPLSSVTNISAIFLERLHATFWPLRHEPLPGGGACSQDPLTFLDFIPCSPLLKPLVPKNDPNNLVKSSPVP